MLDKILDELKKDLEEAKEANSLTKANIEKIVKESTSKIVSELQFNKDISIDLVNSVMNTTITTLKEFGEDTKENIKVSSEALFDGVKETINKQYSKQSKEIEEIYTILSQEIKSDMSKTVDNVKEIGELSFEVLKNAIDAAVTSAKKTLNDKK